MKAHRYTCMASIDEPVIASLAGGVSRLIAATYGNGQYISVLQFQAANQEIVTCRPQLRCLEATFECPFLVLSQRESIICDGSFSSQLLSGAWLEIEYIELLIREEWLEDVGDVKILTLGESQSVQHSGKPGSAPNHALASCISEIGLILTNKSGEQLLIEASTLPYSLRLVIEEDEIRNVLAGVDKRILYPAGSPYTAMMTPAIA